MNRIRLGILTTTLQSQVQTSTDSSRSGSKQLYSRGRQGFIGALLGAIVLTVALWGVVTQSRLILWLAGYVLASLPKQTLIISYQRSSPPSEHVIWWEKWFVVLTFTAALSWGLAGVLLFPVYSMPHQFLLPYL